MHLWFRQVSLGLVAACGSLAAVSRDDRGSIGHGHAAGVRVSPTSVPTRPSRKPTAWRPGSGRPFRPAPSASRFGTSRSRRRVGSRRTDRRPRGARSTASIAPVDTAATARPINFRVALPAEWNHRAVQQGGGGMNGSIPDLSGARYSIGGRSQAQLGFVTYGSDSGHQSGGQRGPARAAPARPAPVRGTGRSTTRR